MGRERVETGHRYDGNIAHVAGAGGGGDMAARAGLVRAGLAAIVALDRSFRGQSP